MKKSDIGVVTIIYAVCLFFFTMTIKLRAEAQIYPLCLIGGLFFLNSLYLLLSIVRLRRGGGIIDDLPQVFKGFMGRQFFFIVGSCIGYMVLMYVAGFYIANVVYLVGVMWRLQVPKFHLGLTVIALALLIYIVFTLFLKVPLPMGILFK